MEQKTDNTSTITPTPEGQLLNKLISRGQVNSIGTSDGFDFES